MPLFYTCFAAYALQHSALQYHTHTENQVESIIRFYHPARKQKSTQKQHIDTFFYKTAPIFRVLIEFGLFFACRADIFLSTIN